MSAESYAEQQFAAALTMHGFTERLSRAGASSPDDVYIAAASTPASEIIGSADQYFVLAVHDEGAPHGFALTRLSEVDR